MSCARRVVQDGPHHAGTVQRYVLLGWDWSSPVAEWVSAIGTGGAFLIASLAWRAQVYERRDTQRAERRRTELLREAQARQLTVWADSEGGNSIDDNSFRWVVRVHWLNGSRQAFHDVEFSVTARGSGDDQVVRLAEPVLPPTSDEAPGSRTIDVVVPRADSGSDVMPDYEVEVSFTDENGLRWHKAGTLLESLVVG